MTERKRSGSRPARELPVAWSALCASGPGQTVVDRAPSLEPGWNLARVRRPLQSPGDSIVAWLVNRESRERRRLAAVALVSRSEWAPNGRAVAVTNPSFRDGSVRDLRGRVLLRFSGRFVGWSQAGLLAVARPEGIRVLDGKGREQARVPESHGAWSPDGTLLAAGGRLAEGDKDMVRVVTPRGAVRLRVADLSAPHWAPDGTLLAFDKALSPRARRPRRPDDPVPDHRSRAELEHRRAALRPPKGRSLVVRRASATVRRFAFAGRGGPCPTSLKGVRWLGRDQILVGVGSGGLQEADLWFVSARGGTPTPAVGKRRQVGGRAGVGPERQPPRVRAWRRAHARRRLQPGRTRAEARGGERVGRSRARDGRGRVSARATLVTGWDADRLRAVLLSDEADQGISVVDPAGRRGPQQLTVGAARWPTWASDGTRVAFEQDGEIRLASLGGGRRHDGRQGHRARGRTERADDRLPPGRRPVDVLARRLRRTPARRRLATRERAHDRPRSRARWSPDSRTLALADRRGVLVVARSGAPSRRIAAPGARGVAWSPDGRSISFARPVGTHSRRSFNSYLWARTELYVVDAAGGEPRRLTRDLANVGRAAWRP